MKFMEYQARETFDQYGIPVMKGVVVDQIEGVEGKLNGLTFPLVVKAQVQVGGRGKAGGIQFADTVEDVKRISQQLLHSDLKGHTIHKLMIVEKAASGKECYLSIILDRLTKAPMIIFSAEGGVDIEETAVTNPSAIIKMPIDTTIGIQKYMIQYIVNKAGLAQEVVPALLDLITRLYEMFVSTDSMLAEINPLLILKDHTLIALDGKVDVDDSALYRQPKVLEYRDSIQEDPLVLDARQFRLLYIPVEDEGDIAVISNGSGMLMSSIDLISKAGMVVGAALDLGGGATADRIKEAIRIVLLREKTKYLFVNIFGGITRCDEVANGVRDAMTTQPKDRCVIVRLEGTNKQKGIDILQSAESDVVSVDGLQEGVQALVNRRESV
jgi:succinyl-CoA synthetase beta subunit